MAERNRTRFGSGSCGPLKRRQTIIGSPPKPRLVRGFAGEGVHRLGCGSKISGQDSGRRNYRSVLRAVPATGLLFAPQHQQLGVRGEDLAQSVLKGAASFHSTAHIV